MRKLPLIAVVGAAGAVAGGLYYAGVLPKPTIAQKAASKPAALPPAPFVTAVAASEADLVESVLVTGTLVAREEILIAPEVEGFRVLELHVDEGARVTKGQVLATLMAEPMEAQLAQNAAALEKSNAAIAQARSQIAQAEARLEEAKASFDRAQPLRRQGHLSESVFDQREASAKTAQAQLAAARDGLKLAEAEKAQVEAQRREIAWRRERTEVRAPADGLISRRTARIGAIASAAGEPMFRLLAKGEVELDAELPEDKVAKVKEGQTARVHVAGVGEVAGRVRLVSSEIDKATRLARVRIYLGDDAALRVGGFGRGHIETARARAISVPVAAVMYAPDGAYVQLIKEGRIETRRVKVGLQMGASAEIVSGLGAGDLIVAKAGTFLREGDLVRPAVSDPKVSEVK